nr:hypothetical protein [Rhodoligotrophos appendicifer]
MTGEGYAPEGNVTPAGNLARLARAAALCNDAALLHRDGSWVVEGDPMEGALLAFAGKVAGDLRSAGRRLDAIPFDSRHRFMAVLTEGAEGRLTHVKGAPEQVLRIRDYRDRKADQAAREIIERGALDHV